MVTKKPTIVNDRTGGENTALHLAAKSGRAKMVEWLIKSGADVNLKDTFGLAPLAVAARSGHVSCVEVLLSIHATVDTKDLSGKTPMFLACEAGHCDIVRLLLDNGANCRVVVNNNLRMIDAAIKNKRE